MYVEDVMDSSKRVMIMVAGLIVSPGCTSSMNNDAVVAYE